MIGAVVAEMSGSDLAVVVVTIASMVAVVAILYGLMKLLETLKDLRAAVDAINERVPPLIDDMAESLAHANEELSRMERVVGSAESISATVDATSKLAYRALSAPVIKTVAVTTGASRAAKRLRKEQ